MLPSLLPGQIVLFRHKDSVRVGDIVMFQHDSIEKIKRVARIDVGRIYVLGDNPDASTDSRHFGWIGVESIRGIMIWPRKKPATVQ